MKGRCPRKDEKENDARKKSGLENAQSVGGAPTAVTAMATMTAMAMATPPKLIQEIKVEHWQSQGSLILNPQANPQIATSYTTYA
jgi:hypothetical protein